MSNHRSSQGHRPHAGITVVNACLILNTDILIGFSCFTAETNDMNFYQETE